MGKRGPKPGTKLVPMTEARKDKFLSVLRSSGSWGAACEVTAPEGAGPRKCYSSWRKLRQTDRQFSEDCNDIIEANSESLIKALIERGRDGVDVEVFYGGRQIFNEDGTPKTIKKYSDPLLLAALRAAFPERFGERKDVHLHHHKSGDSNWEISSEDFKFLSDQEKVNLSAIIATVQAGRTALTHQPRAAGQAGVTLEVAVVDVEPVAVEVVAADDAEAFPAWTED